MPAQGPFEVHAFATYLTRWDSSGPKPSNATYHAFQFIKAIKGRPMGNNADVPLRGQLQRLTQQNADDALAWGATMIGDWLRANYLFNSFLFVPIPSSTVVSVDQLAGTRPHRLAEILAREISGSQIVCALHWRTAKTPASENGPREVYELHPLMCAVPFASSLPIVLVDDVVTKGGTMLAAECRLREIGLLATLGVCVGHTVLQESSAPFAHHCRTFDRYDSALKR